MRLRKLCGDMRGTVDVALSLSRGSSGSASGGVGPYPVRRRLYLLPLRRDLALLAFVCCLL